jgi:hypothetical protein
MSNVYANFGFGWEKGKNVLTDPVVQKAFEAEGKIGSNIGQALNPRYNEAKRRLFLESMQSRHPEIASLIE